MADWIFNGTTKIIKEPSGVGNTVWDFEQDIYSAWKRWVVLGNGQYEPAFIVEGGTPIGDSGLFTGATKILINGWKLMAADHNHQTLIIGNFYSDDSVISVPNPLGNSTIFASGTVGAQGISTSGVLDTVQSNQLSSIFSRLPSDGEELAGKNDTAGGAWTSTEKEDIVKMVMELWKIQGLDPSNPLVVTPNNRQAGDVELEINSDCETFTEVIRQ